MSERSVDILGDILSVDDDIRFCRDIPDAQCHEQPRNIVMQVLAQAGSKSGDVLSDSKVVLPWLLGSVGAPAFMIGLLVPIRESLALLPQMFIGAVIRRFPVRKGFWVASSAVEGLCIALMAVVALLGVQGATAGWLIVGLLVVFSTARGVASIAAKDTLGKTVSKGRRGLVSGRAQTISGAVAVIVGGGLLLLPAAARPAWLFEAMLLLAAASWWLAALCFARIQEYPGATDGGRGLFDALAEQAGVLRRDRELQRFLLVRALLIATALVTPVYVALSQQLDGVGLENLGAMILAAGAASLVSASFWGNLADRSSRLTMALAAMVSAALSAIVLLVSHSELQLADSMWFYAVVIFAAQISHAGVRIGRKTQAVDMVEGDAKAEYIALGNTVTGVALLLFGVFAGGLLMLDLQLTLAVLGGVAACGAVLALTLQRAQ